ncbi:uncharacterized protein BKCO1_24000146 [Diplodia corticola]|uniref:Uncharacterized protein n=1 Tax=Diplodia corticola TaxID=236234 RepID=A0A1J9R204_9PEZI|nr:uncharacterized protein BKCO1_24000146 [Diplodia corticola]OJD34274.1 hypothetical protein BKCO1_24000146 [Diplodia corticola]
MKMYFLTLNGFVCTHDSSNVGFIIAQPSFSSNMTNARCACIFLTTPSLVRPTPSTSAALFANSSLSTPKHSLTNPTTSSTPTVSPTTSISSTYVPSVNAHPAATSLPTSSISITVTL